MSLNSQSINAKFDEIQLFIDRINTSGSFGILCLQESWTDINEDISLFELPGYTLHHQGKQCCKHGGLFVYVHNRYEVEPLNILIFSLQNGKAIVLKFRKLIHTPNTTL